MKILHANRRGFTLVEIMIVVAIIALLASIAVPGFLRARKRSQASRIINDLRLIDNAVDQYAIETNKISGATVSIADWTNYLKKSSNLYTTGKDLFGQRLWQPARGQNPQRSYDHEDRTLRCDRQRFLVALQLT